MKGGTILNESIAVRSSSKDQAYEIIVEGPEDIEYVDELDTDYSTIPLSRSTDEDKELERIRKENILLKNSVLLKERLLELQISLAERNLRRLHQL